MLTMNHSQPVLTPYFTDITVAETLFEQLNREVYHFRRIGYACHATIAVEVRSQTNMIDPHHVDGVVEMFYSINYRCLARIAEETMIECYLHHPVFLGQCSHLVIGKVTRHITQTATATMAAYYRLATYRQCIIKTALCAVRQIDSHAETVHLSYHLSPKLTHTTMCLAATSRVTYLVITIMT